MVYLNDDIYGFDLDAALAEISEQRREQALKFRHELGQRTCVLAYQLLKQGLREEYGITENPIFGYGEHGKPFITGFESLTSHPSPLAPHLYFSLSHCRDAVACVLSDQPVGIDVESIREAKSGLVSYTMNDEEKQLIESAPAPDRQFIRLWTMKEALLKLTGEGITNDIKRVLEDSTYKYTTVERPRYIYTVCS